LSAEPSTKAELRAEAEIETFGFADLAAKRRDGFADRLQGRSQAPAGPQHGQQATFYVLMLSLASTSLLGIPAASS
jgi:hypothetical protein